MKATNDAVASPVVLAARRAKAAARLLARLGDAERAGALAAVAAGLRDGAGRILEANARDLDAARPLVASGAMAEALYRRLKLDGAKVRELVAGVEQVAALGDPIGRVTLATELDDGLELRRVTCPIGVVGVVFESRPDALTQIASLCLRSGNAVLLKGGSEAEHTNRALFGIVRAAAVSAGVPGDALALLGGREDVAALLGAHEWVDLVVPRGSNALVRYVQENTLIPVLGHAEGICHVYVDRAADLGRALDVVVDAKAQYPAACNSVETLLVHEAVAAAFLPAAVARLGAAGVEVRCDERAAAAAGRAGVAPARDADWDTEYCDLVLSVRVVDSLDEAIDHVNAHGSRHTDAILTEDDGAWERFSAEVDAAGVFRNASTRFADGFRYGFGAELGISTGKLHPRGPVGLEGLVTYKYKLVGRGHVVADYTGPDARPFAHRPIPPTRE
jgi:glutamate-5-semialdehyde dehydrogenase